MHAFKSLANRRRLPCIAAALGFAALMAPIFTGCGQPTPLVPRGAWSVSFIQTSSLKCKIGGHNLTIGEVSADKRTKLIPDGDPLDKGTPDVTVSVDCSVVPSGSGFSINAGASAPTAASQAVLRVVVNDMPADASVDKPAKGTVSYQSHNTATQFTQTDCNFYFLAGTAQGVEEGKVWLTFDCDKIAAASDNICEIKPGYIAFENCESKGGT